jgi:hypothetical protein
MTLAKGDLVWLAASISLLQFDEEGTVKRWISTDRPMNVFLVDQYDNTYWKILYDGETWCVPRTLLFPAEEGIEWW